jgi:imidazolonepropionase-like amidohydrolase
VRARRTSAGRVGQVALAAALLLAPLGVRAASAADGGHYAIRAGKVVTVTRGVVDDGVVLVSGGKIEACGPAREIAIPAGYRVIDASREWLMPGMIEAHSHTGMQGDFNDMVSQLNGGMRIGDGVDPDSDVAASALAAGITTIESIPGSGTNHAGFGVIFKTWGAAKEDRIVRRVGVLKIAQAYNPEREAGDVGASRMGMTWLLRDHFARLRAYDEAWAAYERGEAKTPPARDLGLEYGRLAVRRQIPVLIHTWMVWGMTMTVHMFHDELGLYAIASHTEGGGPLVADVVAASGVPVNVGPRVVDFYATGDARALCAAAEYARSGVRDISVNTDALGLDQSLLADKAAMAARFGMDEAEALRTVTISAARALMLEDRIGSIEVGKDADLVVKASSLLDPTTPVEMVFVNGEIAYQREATN